MQTNIPDSALPTELAKDNRISSTYTTNTLIPRLGPLTVTRYLRVIKTLLADYQVASAALKRTAEYQKKHNKWVFLKPAVLQAGNPDLRFKAPFQPTQALAYSLSSRLHDFNSPRPSGELEQVIFSAEPSAQPTAPTPNPRGGNTPIEPLPPGRRFGPFTHMNNFNFSRINEIIDINRDPTANSTNDKAAEEAYDLGNVLHLFAGDNRVISDLAKLGQIKAEGELLSGQLKEIAGKPETNLIEVLTKAIVVPPNTELGHVNNLVQMAVARLPAAEYGDLIQHFNSNSNLKNGLSRYVWDYFRKVDILGGGKIVIPSPDDTEIVNSREWAFQRTERLDMHLSKPEFRGPISSESLAPKSSLKTVESFTLTRFSGESSELSQSQQKTEQHSQSYSQRFQMKLSNMTEEGIQKESEFSKNSTLFNTLREQRRASIDQVISQISRANEQSSYSGQTSTSHSSREYMTQGVDRDQATTELAFQVVSPVRVDVRLEDVGLAWCPRIISPFINLHRLVNDHMEQARREYLDQNTILDPIRPVEVYDKASFKREKHARGRHATQAYNFSYEIPADYQGWELDKPSTKVGFRNGTSDDYNWDEAWNWDDLENWNTYFQSLESDGSTISGRAVLTTTDPEYFNRGFLTFNLALKHLSEESKVALEKYAQEQQEAEAQRLATAARANQYARLRRDELIESYSNQIDLQEEAFRSLIRQIFDSADPQYHSYYTEVLRSCINWDKAGIHYESGDTNSLPYPHLPAAHFLNTPAIRLILPIYLSTEGSFFDALKQGAGDYHQSSAQAVQNYITQYREHIDTLRQQGDDQLLLDSYESELVLGRHLEAVLSRTPFEE